MATLLYLDFDHAVPATFWGRLMHTAHLWRWPVAGVRYDRTRRGWHVVIKIGRELEPAVIVAAQTILGSDPHREAFNLMRVQQLDTVPAFWKKRFNVLYATHAHGAGA